MYKVHVTHAKDLVFSVKAGDEQISIDARGKGLTPPAALLASLGSCIGVYIRKYAESSKLPLENFDISLEAAFSPEPPLAFKTINVSIDLKGANLDERRKQAILEFIKNCPVHNTLKINPRMEARIS